MELPHRTIDCLENYKDTASLAEYRACVTVREIAILMEVVLVELGYKNISCADVAAFTKAAIDRMNFLESPISAERPLL